jgi:two-component system LytT family response regulator
MTTLRTLIVDDEALARRGLRMRLEKHADVEILGECRNGREALASIPELEPDLVFLDIQMPGFDGFDVVRSMQGDDMPMVVFATAFDHFAVKAFEVHAVDYILKPVDEKHLSRALDRARERLVQKLAVSDKEHLLEVIGEITGRAPSEMEKWMEGGARPMHQYPEKIAIRDGGNTTLVPAADIDWVDAAGDYMCVHASGRIHIMRITMKQLEDQLDPALFQRVHRSTIVNLDRVQKISAHMNGEFHLILSDNTRLKMSRGYKEKVQLLLKH